MYSLLLVSVWNQYFRNEPTDPVQSVDSVLQKRANGPSPREKNCAENATGVQRSLAEEFRQPETFVYFSFASTEPTGGDGICDRDRHFSNRCDIYKVAKVVYRNRSDNRIAGLIHGRPYYYHSSAANAQLPSPSRTHTYSQIDRQIHRQTDRQTDRQAGRQAGRQADSLLGIEN